MFSQMHLCFGWMSDSSRSDKRLNLLFNYYKSIPPLSNLAILIKSKINCKNVYGSSPYNYSGASNKICCFFPILQYYTGGPLNVSQSSGNKVP